MIFENDYFEIHSGPEALPLAKQVLQDIKEYKLSPSIVDENTILGNPSVFAHDIVHDHDLKKIRDYLAEPQGTLLWCEDHYAVQQLEDAYGVNCVFGAMCQILLELPEAELKKTALIMPDQIKIFLAYTDEPLRLIFRLVGASKCLRK